MISLDDFPKVKGSLEENVPLNKKAFFGTSGKAEFLFKPADMDDLVFFLRGLPKGIKVTPLGMLSNVLIRSGGIDGVVIILGDWFKKSFVEENVLEVGAGISCSQLSTIAMDHELGGLEFLMGLPGSVGGAIKMNAGCFGSEISDVLIECETIASNGSVRWFKVEDIKASYRSSAISDDSIITRAWFRGNQNVRYSIPKKVREVAEMRKNTQPYGVLTCGSTFKNPTGFKAWKLIEEAGCRDISIGGAKLSEKHCNFIVNDGTATPEDIENLGNQIAQKVLEKTGVKLEWEIVRLGKVNTRL
ncbi:MAG: UDP-N-acetylmuramate dehydrogenase [Alphaproteobacteria bacterium]|nr:UDP-N-acetylmuramate dehydrogenase [Alphaproteobacteria bacterium]